MRILFLSACLLFLNAQAADWPQWLGPNRNGVYPDAGNLAVTWPKDGPPRLWKRSVGEGFSAPVAASGQLILFHRVGDLETVECLQASSGKLIWKFEYPTQYRDAFGNGDGPRATPAVQDGKVFTFGVEGKLHCLDFNTGDLLWKIDLQNEYRAPSGFFGLACSPLIAGNAVLLNIGGRDDAGIVAFHKGTGELLWKATSDEASYSSPAPASFEGVPCALFFTRSGLAGLNPANGEIRFQFPWRSRMRASVNAATPLVIGDYIFISASYQTGAALLQPSGADVKTIWTADDVLSNHYATSIHRDGFLFGFDGRVDFNPGPNLRCVELRTGKIRWSKNGFGAGTALLTGDDILLMMENGELIRIRATPEAYQEVNRVQILPFGVRAYPALAQGLFFARSKDQLITLDLRKF